MLGISPGGGQGNQLQYSCLENPMDREAWWATVHRVTELDMAEVTEHSMYKKWDTTQLLNSIERHKPLRLCNQEDACWRHYAKRNKPDISNYTVNNSIEWVSGKCKTTVTESIYICKWLRMGVAGWLQRGTGYLLGWWKCSISFIILMLVAWLYAFVQTCYYTLKFFAFYYILIISP